jgi:hypothetical protein
LRWADVDPDAGVAMQAQPHCADRRRVLTDLSAYATEASAKPVLAASARNPGRRHRRNDHPGRPPGVP